MDPIPVSDYSEYHLASSSSAGDQVSSAPSLKRCRGTGGTGGGGGCCALLFVVIWGVLLGGSDWFILGFTRKKLEIIKNREKSILSNF